MALGREQARQLLLTGVAGAGQRTGRVTGYSDERVRSLVARPFDEEALSELCPHGLYLARVPRGRRVHGEEPREQPAALLRAQPAMPELGPAGEWLTQ